LRVLIAEDNECEADLLRHSLGQFGYEVTLAKDGKAAYGLVRTGRFRLVVSDWEMPEMTGVELCHRIRQRAATGYIYVILLTSRSGTGNVVEGLNAGADDFIVKPFQPQELYLRLRVGQRILNMESRDLTIFSMAKLAESRDPETGKHLERMREYCRILAEGLAAKPDFQRQVDGEFVQLIFLTSPLHDIGKVGIPDRVLLKPGRLTAEEFRVMQEHTVIGGETLGTVAHAYEGAQFLQMARDIAWTHHEKYDGSGYPRGLAGNEIPLCGRIAAVADVYDALTTRRVYKEAFSHETARSIILDEQGRHFDPAIVETFLEAEQSFLEVRHRLDAIQQVPVAPLSPDSTIDATSANEFNTHDS
jgi:putative two-component system response regulator